MRFTIFGIIAAVDLGYATQPKYDSLFAQEFIRAMSALNQGHIAGAPGQSLVAHRREEIGDIVGNVLAHHGQHPNLHGEKILHEAPVERGNLRRMDALILGAATAAMVAVTAYLYPLYAENVVNHSIGAWQVLG